MARCVYWALAQPHQSAELTSDKGPVGPALGLAAGTRRHSIALRTGPGYGRLPMWRTGQFGHRPEARHHRPLMRAGRTVPKPCPVQASGAVAVRVAGRGRRSAFGVDPYPRRQLRRRPSRGQASRIEATHRPLAGRRNRARASAGQLTGKSSGMLRARTAPFGCGGGLQCATRRSQKLATRRYLKVRFAPRAPRGGARMPRASATPQPGGWHPRGRSAAAVLAAAERGEGK